jgi:hypothetical protein
MAVHFVGFKPSDTRRWANAVAIWGEPHYVHDLWDHRAYGEYDPATDTVVFAWQSPRRGGYTTVTVPDVYDSLGYKPRVKGNRR